MREILFRGKLSHSKEWVYGNLIIARNGNPYIIPFYVFEPDGHHLIIDSDNPFWVDKETVGKFTGLVDNSGVKIFSDDLLKDIKGDIFRIYEIAGGFCIKSSVWKTDINDFNFTDILIAASLTDAQMQSYILESCEIIGNIHDKHVL